MKLATGTTAIVNGTLIDGNGGPPIRDAVLIVRDGRIVSVGAANKVQPPPTGTPVIDARGGTIMPGLVEAHFHATYFNVSALEDLDIKYPVR